MNKALLVCLCLSFISCGKIKKWVTDVKYETVDYNGQQWVSTEFTLDIGDAELPNNLQALPEDFGSFRATFEGGVNTIGLDLNITSLLKLPSGPATLPNGEGVPIYTNGNGMVQVPIGKNTGKAYVSVSNDMTLVGAAFAIEQLDRIDLGDTTSLWQYSLGNVKMFTGIFLSEEIRQSGLVIFADLGGLGFNKVYDPGAFVLEKTYMSKRKKRRMLKRIRNILKKDKKLLLLD